VIEVRNLVKEYPETLVTTTALAGVTFTITKGEFVSIMGPSGSGKSTLMHILSFLDRPTSGEYVFEGTPMSELEDNDLAHIRNEKLGFVFQSFNLLGRASVYENVELPLLYSPLPVSARRERVEEVVRAVGLSDKLYIEAGKLSGGQKQRVAIARALVNSPRVIFADEPTGNLDSKSGLAIMDILQKLHAQGNTIILVTHELATARFGTRLIKIKDGLIDSDTPILDRLYGAESLK
jgi:putative ABC transport system ATP-binding protein